MRLAVFCAGTWCEYPLGNGGGTKPNFLRYASWAETGAMPSSSSASKLKTAIVPSEDTAYSVRPSVDLTGTRVSHVRDVVENADQARNPTS